LLPLCLGMRGSALNTICVGLAPPPSSLRMKAQRSGFLSVKERRWSV
jgi:hypothetical protein